MRVTTPDDPDGSSAIRELATSVVGETSEIRFLGAVRNVVHAPHDGYEWPIPHAYFGVWASDDAPRVDGTWVSIDDLCDRHWYPLVT